MSLMELMVISGIFGKSSDLDILPPPPPFPDIGIGKELKDAAKEARNQGKQSREEYRERKLELERQKSIEKKKGEEQRKKQEEMQKKLLEKQKKSDAKKEKIKIPKLIREIDEGKIELPKPEQKKSFFGKLFGKKDEELERELEELEEIRPEPRLAARKLPELGIPGIPKAKGKIPKALERAKPLKGISQAKLPKIEFEEKDFDDIKEAEDEIKKAIDGMKEKSRAPNINMLFKRKEKDKKKSLISEVSDAGKIETPEVMPRTFDRIDNVQEIEERIHKARMCLMDFKFDDAKRIYMEIMRLYSGISQKDRYKVYQDINDLYYERKSAEKFSKI